MFGLGYLGCAFVTSIPMLIIVFGIGVGVGSGLMYPTMMGYTASIMPEKQGFAAGLMAGVYGGAAIIWSPILAGLLESDYATTFLIIGPLCLVVLVICSFFIGPVPEGYVAYKKGESWKYYVNQAGGFGNRSKKSHTYIVYQNGTVSQVGKGKIEPGCEIIVPQKGNKDMTNIMQWVSIGTSMASLATMFATIGNLIK